MKRQQVEVRTKQDIDERVDVLLKTDYKCAHCGCDLHLGDNASIDHFVPLKKGGTNDFVNLIPLCKKCNEEKGSKIIEPFFLKYLPEDEYRKLVDYYADYLVKYKYVSRGNLFANDRYDMPVYLGPKMRSKAKLNRKCFQHFILERVYPSDMPDVETYYIDYLKHYDLLESEDEAKMNLEFWYRFGSIYKICDKSGSIRMLITILLADMKPEKHFLNMHIFSRYASNASVGVLGELPFFLSDCFTREQDLPYVRFRLAIPAHDKLAKLVKRGEKEGSFIADYHEHVSAEHQNETDEFDESSSSFYRSFHDIEEDLEEFFSRPGYDKIRYMKEMVVADYRLGARQLPL